MADTFAAVARRSATVAVLISAAGAQTIIQPTTPIAPNGIGATTTELIVSQPYGVGAPQSRGIYSESATVASLTNSACPGCPYLVSESIAAATYSPGRTLRVISMS